MLDIQNKKVSIVLIVDIEQEHHHVKLQKIKKIIVKNLLIIIFLIHLFAVN